MGMSFAEVLARLQSRGAGAGRHIIGSASFLDEEEYHHLGTLFDEAVEAFTASEGEPIQSTPRFPGQDVDRARCWRRGQMTLYAVLTFEDNTRIRTLALGLAHSGEVVAPP